MNFNTNILVALLLFWHQTTQKLILKLPRYIYSSSFFFLFFLKITIHTINKMGIKEPPTVHLDISVTEGGVLKRRK